MIGLGDAVSVEVESESCHFRAVRLLGTTVLVGVCCRRHEEMGKLNEKEKS